MTKFLGAVHEYTDMKLSRLTIPSQCCLYTSFSAHLAKLHCGGTRHCKVFQHFSKAAFTMRDVFLLLGLTAKVSDVFFFLIS